MKEIKYRVWQNIKDKLYHAIFDLNYKSDVIIYCNEFNDFLYKDQYTGLKDKNGKEIYEGDIVSDYFGKGIIIYCSDYGMYVISEILELDPRQFRSMDISVGLMTIMGNIHENPELLKENKHK